MAVIVALLNLPRFLLNCSRAHPGHEIGGNMSSPMKHKRHGKKMKGAASR